MSGKRPQRPDPEDYGDDICDGTYGCHICAGGYLEALNRYRGEIGNHLSGKRLERELLKCAEIEAIVRDNCGMGAAA